MPIYEYKCDKCGVIEVMQRITEAPLKKCPTCKGKVERMISRGSFILKGSGWYATDYAKKGATSNGETASAASDSATTSSGDASSKANESKPAGESKASVEKPASSKSSGGEKSSAAKTAD